MNEQKRKKGLKLFGASLLTALIITAFVTALAVIFDALPYRTTDTSVSSLPIINFKTAVMAVCDKPLIFAVSFVFVIAFASLTAAVLKKGNLPFKTVVFSVLLSVPFCALSMLLFTQLETVILWLVFIIGFIPFAFYILFMNKNIKFKPLLFSFGAVISALLIALTFWVSSTAIKNNIGHADKTGSWAAINQQVKRGDKWEKIVKNSPFKLGKIHEVKDDDGSTENFCELGSYPNLDGSTVCVPMAAEFARQHLGFSDDDCETFIDFSTTHGAYEKLIETKNKTDEYGMRTTWLSDLNSFVNIPYECDLFLGTEPSGEEIEMAEKAGVSLVKKPVCYDAFVFITHKDNPVDNLTIEQIRDIYSGKITNWKDVGGKNEKIKAFQREANSGSQTAMENLVMGGRNMIDPIKVAVVEGMGELVDEVAEYQNKTASLGYTYRYYIDTLYKNDNIKTIAVDGVAPTDENIKNGSYPFSTNYYGVIRGGDEKATGGKFLDWILSEEGQKCVRQAGYITVM